MTINIVSISGQAYVSGNYVNVASIVADTYDRKGTIIWYDNFEDVFNKWETDGSGTGNSVDITSDAALYHDSSCMLACGSTANLYSLIKKSLSLPADGNIGLQLSYSIDAAFTKLEIYINKYTGTQLKIGGLQIDRTNNRLQYIGDSGSWVTLETDLDFLFGTTRWYTAKMVLNFDTNKYVRILHRDKTFSLDNNLRVLSSSFPSCTNIQVKATGTAAFNAKVYVDNVILTQYEP